MTEPDHCDSMPNCSYCGHPMDRHKRPYKAFGTDGRTVCLECTFGPQKA